ncbi:MAG: MBL fold metallo-hydrolase [Lachnospiraceae bacterium]|jgi:hydroxyacylglutathione hydrolase|nr:MBL fold metallo-hydrolase [Lachnospiraceae bacterium]
MTEEIYKTEQIAPDTYRIEEAGAVNCYLLVGKKKALLIDTGLGVGCLKEEAEKLTDLPIEAVLTHAHCDHAGGIGWFDHYYVHRSDTAPVYHLLSSRLAASVLLPRGTKLPHQPQKPKAIPIDSSFSFELGERTVRVKNVPGHTNGSIVLLDQKEKQMFTGDDINESLWMQLPGCTTLRQWLSGGRTLLSFAGEYTAWCGHGPGRQSEEQMRTTYEMVEKLSEGKNAFFPHTGYYPDRESKPQIVFNEARRH